MIVGSTSRRQDTSSSELRSYHRCMTFCFFFFLCYHPFAVILYGRMSRHWYSFVKRAKILCNSQWDHFLRVPDDVGASQCLFLTRKCDWLHCFLLCTKGHEQRTLCVISWETCFHSRKLKCVCMHVHAYVYVCMHVRMCVCMWVCVCTCTCMCKGEKVRRDTENISNWLLFWGNHTDSNNFYLLIREEPICILQHKKSFIFLIL